MTRWRIFSLLLFVGMLIIPLQAYALDSRCYTETACKAIRLDFGAVDNKEALEGFIVDTQTKEICGETRTINGSTENMGFCLAAGQAETALDFAGRNQFRDIADFIAFGYQYTVGLASLIAILVIIVAGFQWAASAGNQGTISSAKARIFGAVTGLVIAATSFIILDTINPRLTQLRPPNAFLLNQITIQPETCALYPETDVKMAIFEEVGPEAPTRQEIDTAHKNNQDKFTLTPQEAQCGFYHLIDTYSENICRGTACREGFICHQPNKNIRPACRAGSIGGQITIDQLSFGSEPQQIIDDDLMIIEICKNGDIEDVDNIESTFKNGFESYLFPQINNTSCGTLDDVLGYYLVAELTDVDDLLVVDVDFSADDDFFAIGKNPATSGETVGNCDVNLSVRAYELLNNPITCEDESEDARCGCAGVAYLINEEIHTKSEIAAADNGTRLTRKIRKEALMSQIVPYLISPEQVKNGFVCNIPISRTTFPELNTSDNHENDSCDGNI